MAITKNNVYFTVDSLDLKIWQPAFERALRTSDHSDLIGAIENEAGSTGLGSANESSVAVWINSGATAVLAVIGIVQIMSTDLKNDAYAESAESTVIINFHGDAEDVQIEVGINEQFTEERAERLHDKLGVIRAIEVCLPESDER